MDYLPVYVRARDYADVTRYALALLEEPTDAGSEDVEPASVEVGPGDEPSGPVELANPREWPEDKLVAFFHKTTDDGRTLLTLQMNQPGKPVGMAECEAAMGRSFTRVQAAGRSLTAQMRRLGMSQWPFDAAIDARTGRMAYTMSERTAAIIRELAVDDA